MNKIDVQAKKNLLAGLLEDIRYGSDAVESYLDQIADYEVLNPTLAFRLNPMRSDELVPQEFFAGFGIRRITLNASHSKLSLSDRNFIGIINKNLVKYKWHEFKNQSVIEDLKQLFNNASIIEFSNWSNIPDASDIWDNLRREVIQPLNKKDFEFIFDLGDPTKRSVSDVSEVLDIVSDFSLYGRVILLLDIEDAVWLWAGFNGLNTTTKSTDLAAAVLNKVYRYLVDILRIQNATRAHQLLILSPGRVTLFSGQQKIEMEGGAAKITNVSEKVRDYFIAGYSLGLLLRLEMPHNVALALAISGVNFQNRNRPNIKALVSCIEHWIADLEILLPLQIWQNSGNISGSALQIAS